jgi:hypothetical protein
MGLYNVVQPCTVGGKSYVHPTVQPIKVRDDEAKPLVVSGHLTYYGRPPVAVVVDSPESPEVKVRPRRKSDPPEDAA